jgi:type II secretory pathway component PulK
MNSCSCRAYRTVARYTAVLIVLMLAVTMSAVTAGYSNSWNDNFFRKNHAVDTHCGPHIQYDSK